jgi:hypothetical protein
MTFTIDQILGWKPCEDYTRKRIEGLFSGRESITAEELAELDIPIEDKIWVFLHTKHAPEITERIVTRAVTNHALTCGVSDVETWARDWLDGTDRSREAARAADEAARAATARAAAWARAATWAAADAAWAAAAAAAADAAEATETAEAAARASVDAAEAAWMGEATETAWMGERAWMEERKLQLADCLAVMRKGCTE